MRSREFGRFLYPSAYKQISRMVGMPFVCVCSDRTLFHNLKGRLVRGNYEMGIRAGGFRCVHCRSRLRLSFCVARI